MKLYNTFTNKIEEFKSIEARKVKMYVCGPTVYNYIHIGNARPIVVFDVLARILKKKGYEVDYVQNFTDIDDKIIKKANEENVSCKEISEKYISAFMQDIEKLNILNDIVRPKVTENLESIYKMIQTLLDRDYAYKKGNDIVFSINKFKEYGKLSKQKLDELNKGVRIEVDNEKENPFDFILWKGKKEGEEYFSSPFGDGRPGWHIECSAMIKEILGDNIDIHCGGQDLIFPHHENEIAQSICSSDTNKNFVNYWLHNAYITINSEKMSKSLGNFKLLREILNEFDGNVVRYFILTSHYRKGLNFSYQELENSKKTLENISKSAIKFKKLNNGVENPELSKYIISFTMDFISSLEDDINTPKALASIAIFIKAVNNLIKDNDKYNYTRAYNILKEMLEGVLGVKIMEFEEKNNNNNDDILNILLDIRKILREQKNYELSDKIRDELRKINIEVNDK